MKNNAVIDYAQSLLELRCLLDKDQSWVADKVGVSESTVSNWETNRHPPNTRHAYKIRKLLEEHKITPIFKGDNDGFQEEASPDKGQ